MKNKRNEEFHVTRQSSIKNICQFYVKQMENN